MRRSLLALALAGCAPGSPFFASGTYVEFEGPVCGTAEPITMRLSDAKDRSGFAGRVTVTGPDGATCEIALDSSDSSASAVIAAQSAALSALAVEVTKMVAAGTLP